jgi:uncharacterized phage protein (TIGR02218 family)
MKTQSVALAAHRASGTTTLAFLWLVTRLDGMVFAFTSASRDILYEGILYLAAPGFTPSAIASSADLAVTNLEIVGPVSVATISDDDVIAGLWDHATIEVSEVNYMDLSMGRMIISTGTLGQISAGQLAFTAEQRGPEQPLQQPVGRVYSPTCDAVLGDARCGINLPALQIAGTVTAVASNRAFTASALLQVSDYFGAGVVTWVTGLNAGLRMEVQTFAAGVFGLALNMPYAIAIGDTFTVVPGCRKRRTEDCLGKFNNVINFRGFPDLPGNNKVLGNAGLASA